MRFRFLLTISFLLVVYHFSTAINIDKKRKKLSGADSTIISVDYLKLFVEDDSIWYTSDEELKHKLQSLIHYFEDEKPDSVITWLENYQQYHTTLFSRSYLDVEDSLQVPGYVSETELEEELRRLDRSVRESIVIDKIPIPEQLLSNLSDQVKTIPAEDSNWLINTGKVSLPDSLLTTEVVPDSLINRADILRRDSIKNVILEKARIQYNQELISNYIDSISTEYRNEYVAAYSQKLQMELADSINFKNTHLLKNYNDSIVSAVNDSIQLAINNLAEHLKNEPTSVWIYNSDMKATELSTGNTNQPFTRLFIKNEHNDSLNIKIENAGKNSMLISIDDGVTLNRFKTQNSRELALRSDDINKNLRDSKKMFTVITPWKLGIDGSLGFTQTYLSNWKKGGKSSLSTLMIFKSFANYTKNKVKWENSLEIRNGWINPADDKIQKNDDKFEFITRFGISAFKKWYYSGEVDFQTQLFNGYNYPDRETLISGFMSPAKTMFKLGLDYNPNDDFSLFLSPITAKNVFVKDTVNIDATNYSIEDGKKSFWNLGLNAELKYKRSLIKDITYETKYKMFVNYKSPFSAIDVDWENNLSMQVNSYISLKLLVHLIYDDNVTFATDKVDAEGNTIYKPKWQLKEFMTIGFSYKLNKQIKRSEKLN